MTICTDSRSSGKLESHKGIREPLPACGRAATARGDKDVLRAILPHIRDGCGIAVGRQVCDPQFLAGLRVERAEPVVDRGANEDEAAGSGDAATDISDAALQTQL